VQLQKFKFFVLIIFYSNIFSQEKYTLSSLTAKKIKGHIKIDGYLYEKKWKEAGN